MKGKGICPRPGATLAVQETRRLLLKGFGFSQALLSPFVTSLRVWKLHTFVAKVVHKVGDLEISGLEKTEWEASGSCSLK